MFAKTRKHEKKNSICLRFEYISHIEPHSQQDAMPSIGTRTRSPANAAVAATNKVTKPSSKQNASLKLSEQTSKALKSTDLETVKTTEIINFYYQPPTIGHPGLKWPVDVINCFTRLVREYREERYEELNTLSPDALFKIQDFLTKSFRLYSESFTIKNLKIQLDYIVKLYLFYYLPLSDEFNIDEYKNRWDTIEQNYESKKNWGIDRLGKLDKQEFDELVERRFDYVRNLNGFVEDLEVQSPKRLKFLEKKLKTVLEEISSLMVEFDKLESEKKKTKEDEETLKELEIKYKSINEKHKDELDEISDLRWERKCAKGRKLWHLIKSWDENLKPRERKRADKIANNVHEIDEETLDDILKQSTDKKKFNKFHKFLKL